MAEDFDRDILSALVRSYIQADESELSFEKVTTGKFNTTYFVGGGPGPLVLRVAPPDDAGFVFYERGMMAQEPGIHKLVRERTNVPVAEILAYDCTRSIVDRDYLLMRRLPGMALTHFACTQQQLDRVLEQTGAHLRQIHDITAEKYGYLGEHNCMPPQADWASAFRIMWDKLIDDIVLTGYYDADEERFAKNLLDKHMKHFGRRVTSRLLHMDIWSQNILVDGDGNVTGIVDFDRALWGDKEIEFAVLDYCGISEPAFWRGYGKTRDVSDAAQIRRSFYLLYEIQKYIIIHHHRHTKPESAAAHKRQAMGMLERL